MLSHPGCNRQLKCKWPKCYGTDFLSMALGIIITTTALALFALYLLRAKNRSPLLLWLGWFAFLYGIRVLVKTPTTELLIDLPQTYRHYAESVIGNFILVPALLFSEQLYGKGWRSSMRRAALVLRNLRRAGDRVRSDGPRPLGGVGCRIRGSDFP